jgi:hypothetical protein
MSGQFSPHHKRRTISKSRIGVPVVLALLLPFLVSSFEDEHFLEPPNLGEDFFSIGSVEVVPSVIHVGSTRPFLLEARLRNGDGKVVTHSGIDVYWVAPSAVSFDPNPGNPTRVTVDPSQFAGYPAPQASFITESSTDPPGVSFTLEAGEHHREPITDIKAMVLGPGTGLGVLATASVSDPATIFFHWGGLAAAASSDEGASGIWLMDFHRGFTDASSVWSPNIAVLDWTQGGTQSLDHQVAFVGNVKLEDPENCSRSVDRTTVVGSSSKHPRIDGPPPQPAFPFRVAMGPDGVVLDDVMGWNKNRVDVVLWDAVEEATPEWTPDTSPVIAAMREELSWAQVILDRSRAGIQFNIVDEVLDPRGPAAIPPDVMIGLSCEVPAGNDTIGKYFPLPHFDPDRKVIYIVYVPTIEDTNDTLGTFKELLGRACPHVDGRKFALIVVNAGLKTISTLAHEIGHALGLNGKTFENSAHPYNPAVDLEFYSGFDYTNVMWVGAGGVAGERERFSLGQVSFINHDSRSWLGHLGKISNGVNCQDYRSCATGSGGAGACGTILCPALELDVFDITTQSCDLLPPCVCG